MGKRTVDNCPHRTAVPSGAAHCGILRELSGLSENHQLTLVDPDACEACCETFPATADDPNLVVASLAIALAENVIAANGIEDCPTEKARRVLEFAEKRIPVLNADEQDLIRDDSADASEISIDQLRQLLPTPTNNDAPDPTCPVNNWAVAVTTSPRRQPTLAPCLDRLLTCGWDQPLLSIDGDVDIPHRFRHLPVTQRTSPIGAWPNYYLTLSELVMQSPHADAYMVIQDDSIFANCPELKTYLEDVLWPNSDMDAKLPPLVSLYCASDDTRETNGWCQHPNQWKLGALAMIFSPAAVHNFLRDEHVFRHRLHGGKHSLAGIDAVIGDWAIRNQVPVWYPTPSLVQHIGNVSTIWESSGANGMRRASRFINDEVQ